MLICGSILSCDRGPANQVTLYTSIDEPTARPIIQEFERRHGVRVVIVTDTEASKSVGLAEKLRAERDRPRCDVWWGNEPFHTINLAEEGLFKPYDSPSAADVPAMYRDPNKRWAGNALRARVIIAAGNMSSAPLTLRHFSELKSTTMARPAVGTVAGHVAAIYLRQGDSTADDLFARMRSNGITLLGGNGTVAEAVARAEFSYGLTDNDDVANVARDGTAVGTVLPDQAAGGTLMIPTTVALVANRPENANAMKLIDYLLSKEVEQKLIEAQFAGWSIRGGENQPRAMQIDYVEVAKKMPEAVRRATAILEGRQP